MFVQCDKKETQLNCNKEFFKCTKICASICEKTIKFTHEFGKCFTICNDPCRKEYCKKINYDEKK